MTRLRSCGGGGGSTVTAGGLETEGDAGVLATGGNGVGAVQPVALKWLGSRNEPALPVD